MTTPWLVSEARPIPWDKLSSIERNLIEGTADKWIEAVLSESSSEKRSLLHELEDIRTGRVLFIAGERGAGKTSFLLTILRHWDNDHERRPRGSDEKVGCTEKLKVIKPVLDFDPLPHRMSLHGWLLEPWRRIAAKLQADESHVPQDAIDLNEHFHDLYERAVMGWSSVAAEGKGLVEKTLAHEEQSRGWLETTDLWRTFINALVCRQHRCPTERCHGAHPFVFVVAIDDVDQQVERLPELLHALRLLRHPNVAYLLTGDVDHLEFVMTLDYVQRHGHALGAAPSAAARLEPVWQDIEDASKRLSNALIEKAIPKHARLELESLTLGAVLDFATEKGTARGLLENAAIESLLSNKPTVAKRKIVTARQAQHCIDRLARSAPVEGNVKTDKTPRAQTTHFVADLCGTKIVDDGHAGKPSRLAMRGKLTTRFGPTLRELRGDQLRVVLSTEPSVELEATSTATSVKAEPRETERALFVQLVQESETPLFVAPDLQWSPNDGILATHVDWQPATDIVTKTAIFQWPWLVRPSAEHVLDLDRLATDLAGKMGISLSDLDDAKLLTSWLFKNIDWFEKQPGPNGKKVNSSERGRDEDRGDDPRRSLRCVAKTLVDLREKNDAPLKTEIRDWARDLFIMTAPYFGLPVTLAWALREALSSSDLVESQKTNLLDSEDTGFITAIVKRQSSIVSTAIDATLRPGKVSGSQSKFDRKFLADRKSLLEDEQELLWLTEGSVRFTRSGEPLRRPKPKSTTGTAAEKPLADE